MMQPFTYTAMLKTFRRHAANSLKKYIPGKLNLARRDIDRFLYKERKVLQRWFLAMSMDLLTAEEFGKLFGCLNYAFPLRKLRAAGLSEEQLHEVSRLLQKLFRAIMITSVGESKHGLTY